jgi:hypothetical protein
MGCILALIGAVIMTAGCQAIGGVDLNKAMLGLFQAQSLEGSGTLTLELLQDGGGTVASGDAAEQADFLKAMSPMKLHLEHMKIEGRNRWSVQGNLEIPKGAIPFEASLTPEELVLKPAGAVKPFVLKLNELGSAGLAQGLPAVTPKQEQVLKELQNKLSSPEFMKPVYSYFINGLPNPKNTSLSHVTETINGESVSMVKAGTELSGEELVPWLKKVLVRLMQDDQGLKEVVGLFYDAFKPVFEAGIGMPDQAMGMGSDPAPASPMNPLAEAGGLADQASSRLGESFKSIAEDLLSDRETAVEVLHTEVKQAMVVLLAMLGQADRSDSGLDSNSGVKTAIYLDSSLNLRGTDMELTIRNPKGTPEAGISGIKASSSFRYWNVGQPVKADTLPSADAAQLNAASQPESLLHNLDSGSVLYRLLKEDLHVTRKTGYFFVPEEAAGVPADYGVYLDRDTSMVRAKDLVNSIGGTLKWNEADRSLILSDRSGTHTLQMKVGLTEAAVNGVRTEAPASAVIQGDSAYVPLRFAAEALGGHVAWNERIRMLTVTVE